MPGVACTTSTFLPPCLITPAPTTISYLQLQYEVLKNEHTICNYCIVHTQTLTLHSSQNLLGHRSEPESCAAQSGTDRSCSTLSCTASRSWGMLQQRTVSEALLSICLIRTEVQTVSTPQWPRVKCQTQHYSSMFLTTIVNIGPLTNICKVKCTLVEALRLCSGRTAHRGSRGIALLFLDNGTRRGWGVSITPQLLFTPRKDPLPIVQEAGWAPWPVWTGVKNLAPNRIRSPDRPARSQSLFRLHYPAHHKYMQ